MHRHSKAQSFSSASAFAAGSANMYNKYSAAPAEGVAEQLGAWANDVLLGGGAHQDQDDPALFTEVIEYSA